MSRRAENLRRKRQRKIMLIRKYIRFTFCCVLIVVLAFAINYLKKNMNNISEGGNSGGNNVKKIKESKEESAKDVIKNYAEKHGYTLEDYPEIIKKLFERNKETKDFVLKYPEKKGKAYDIDFSKYKKTTEVPLFMQWDQRWGYYTYAGDCMGITGCGPTCLSMVAVYVTGNIKYTPKMIADFAMKNGYADEENGSSWSLISEGGRQLGMQVIEIPLDEQRVKDNLEVGNPIICVVGPGDFTTQGHFIVLTKYKDGKVSVNDPNSKANSNKQWVFEDIKDQIKNLWVLR